MSLVGLFLHLPGLQETFIEQMFEFMFMFIRQVLRVKFCACYSVETRRHDSLSEEKKTFTPIFVFFL